MQSNSISKQDIRIYYLWISAVSLIITFSLYPYCPRDHNWDTSANIPFSFCTLVCCHHQLVRFLNFTKKISNLPWNVNYNKFRLNTMDKSESLLKKETEMVQANKLHAVNQGWEIENYSSPPTWRPSSHHQMVKLALVSQRVTWRIRI